MSNVITWFEIPAVNLDRAVEFYAAVVARPLRKEVFAGMNMAVFAYERGVELTGAVVEHEGYVPTEQGTLVYLNVEGDIDGALERVLQAGGSVIAPKSHTPAGYIAIMLDTEGNRVGLHSTI